MAKTKACVWSRLARKRRHNWLEAERAVAHADAIVAFVGLSPEVEGEELHIDTPGSAAATTAIDLPATQKPCCNM